MPRFLGSPNGRLFAVVNERELTLYRHDIALWKRSIELEDFTVLGLGNRGSWFVLAPAGLYVWPHDPKLAPMLLESLGVETLARQGKRLGRVQIGSEGTAVCVEIITEAGDKAGSRFRPTRSAGEQVHEFFFYDLTDNRQVRFHGFAVPPALSQARVWDLSRNFRWMAFAAPGKGNNIKITVQDLHNEFSPLEFIFQEEGFRGVHVNRDGTVCVDTFHHGHGRLYLLTRGHVETQVRPPSSFEIEFLAGTYLALRMVPGPFMLYKTLADKLISHVDMAALRTLGVEWGVHYDQREEVNLLTLREGVFRILHTDPGRFDMDFKRWKTLLAGENLIQGADPEAVATPVVYEDGMPDMEPNTDPSRDERHKALSKDLIRSVQAVRQEKDQEVNQVRQELQKRLEALRLLFGTGGLAPEEYERRRTDLEQQLASLPVPTDKKTTKPQRLSLHDD